MKRTLLVAASIAAFSMPIFFHLAYPGCGTCGGDSYRDPFGGGSGLFNTKCPVTGERVYEDTAFKMDYKGQKIGFSSRDAMEKFRTNPDFYLMSTHELDNIEDAGQKKSDNIEEQNNDSK